MKDATERKNIADWKRMALNSTKEKLPLWTMLGIAERALSLIEEFGDDPLADVARKAQEEMKAVAMRYDLKELIAQIEAIKSFEIDPRDKR